jgi:hypothetical protein
LERVALPKAGEPDERPAALALPPPLGRRWRGLGHNSYGFLSEVLTLLPPEAIVAVPKCVLAGDASDGLPQASAIESSRSRRREVCGVLSGLSMAKLLARLARNFRRKVCHMAAYSHLLCIAQRELELGDARRNQPALGHRLSDTNPWPFVPCARPCID